MRKILLSQIYIYPVKSLPGFRVNKAILTPRGLLNDRRWMLVDEKGNFITQRLYPQLALLDVKLSNPDIHITLPDNQKITLPQITDSGADIAVKVWSDSVKAKTTDVHANDLISRYLGIKCQFVYMPDSSIRSVDPEYSQAPTDQVSFADGFPLLLISEASLQDLNHRLSLKNINPLPMIRFRPNIAVSGCDAFAEDTWKDIIIGDNHLRVVKPCSRCVMTTVNPDTGEKGKEPLATLLEYRKTGNKAYFGQNVLPDMSCDNSMLLTEGDEVQIIPSND